MSFSANNRYLVTCCEKEVKLWVVDRCKTAKEYCLIQDDKATDGSVPHVAVSESGEVVVITRGGLMFEVWKVSRKGEAKKQHDINLL